MKKKFTPLLIVMVFGSLLSPSFFKTGLISNVHGFPVLDVDLEFERDEAYYIGAKFSAYVSAITDNNGQEDGVTIMAFYDNIVPALSAPVVAPYLLHEKITFVTNTVSSGQRTFSVKCTDYLGNTVWSNHTIFIDKTPPEIDWVDTNQDRLEVTKSLMFNWSVADPEGLFDRIIISFGDGSESLNSTSPRDFGYKYFFLEPFVYNKIIEYTFKAYDLAGNVAYEEGEVEIYVPEEARPTYAPSYVSELNDTWGRLRNRDAIILSGAIFVVLMVTIPITIITVIKFKKRRNIV